MDLASIYFTNSGGDSKGVARCSFEDNILTLILLDDSRIFVEFPNYSDGKDGTNGTNGTSITISSTSVTYQTSSSGTTTPTGTWLTTVPTVTKGQFLWTKTVVTYSDNTTTTSYIVGYIGKDGTNGTNGTNGVSPTITTTSITNGNRLTITDSSGTKTVDVMNGIDGVVSLIESTEATQELLSNKYYKWGEVASLTITLAEPTDTSIVNKYMFEFISGATATTLNVPSTLKWFGEVPTIEANKTYQISILNGIGTYVSA